MSRSRVARLASNHPILKPTNATTTMNAAATAILWRARTYRSGTSKCRCGVDRIPGKVRFHVIGERRYGYIAAGRLLTHRHQHNVVQIAADRPGSIGSGEFRIRGARHARRLRFLFAVILAISKGLDLSNWKGRLPVRSS